MASIAQRPVTNPVGRQQQKYLRQFVVEKIHLGIPVPNNLIAS